MENKDWLIDWLIDWYLNKIQWYNVLLITKASEVYSNKHLLSHTNPIQILPIHFLQRHRNIILITLHNLKSGLLTSGFPTKLYMNFSPLSCMLDAPPSSSSLIWSSQYLKRSTNYEVSHYIIFSILLPFFTLRSKYSQHPVLKHRVSKLFPYFCKVLHQYY